MKNILCAALLLLALCPRIYAQKTAPMFRVENFEVSEDTSGNFNQAGCLFNRPSVKGPKIVFTFTQQGLIKINGKLRIMPSLPSKEETSLDNVAFQDKDYKVRIKTHTLKKGALSGTRTGTMRVDELKTGKKLVIKVEGICGS